MKKKVIMHRIVISIFFISTVRAFFNNAPADSVINQPAEENVNSNETGVQSSIEKEYYNYLTQLNFEQSKQYWLGQGSLLRKTIKTTEALNEYKIQEYRTYLDKYFPNAHSDYIQRFMIETYIDLEKWNEVQANLLKFAYLYQESPLRGPVLENGSVIIQEKEYFETNREKLLPIIQGQLETGEIYENYFQYLITLLSFKDDRLTSIVAREVWEFIRLYTDKPQTSTLLFLMAEIDLVSDNPHSALMIYKKLMTLFPSSDEFATALYKTGTIQQDIFSEFETATASFRQFSEQFPEDDHTSDSQYRIAMIADQNFKDWTTAIDEYEKLVTQFPKSENAITALMRAGEIQADKLKQRDVAIATYNRLATEYTDDTVNATEALQRAGKLYEKNKAFQEAVNQYMKVHEKYPGTEGALESLEKSAKLYEKKLKRKDQAIEMLNIIVDQFPDTKNSKKAEKKLKKLNK
jgi:TolA-binding protein|tara:strand:- start:129 stop:1520 length:1392 start_codon:yes stop_codon:yes gene_type:complete